MARPIFEADAVHAANLIETIDCVAAGTVSKTRLNLPKFKQVLFALDAGQELSEHRAPYLAIVQVLDGHLRMNVAGQPHELRPASWLLMPPDCPHDVHAEAPTRFLLTLLKDPPPAAG